jgi:hypothetical protein
MGRESLSQQENRIYLLEMMGKAECIREAEVGLGKLETTQPKINGMLATLEGPVLIGIKVILWHLIARHVAAFKSYTRLLMV